MEVLCFRDGRGCPYDRWDQRLGSGWDRWDYEIAVIAVIEKQDKDARVGIPRCGLGAVESRLGRVGVPNWEEVGTKLGPPWDQVGGAGGWPNRRDRAESGIGNANPTTKDTKAHKGVIARRIWHSRCESCKLQRFSGGAAHAS